MESNGIMFKDGQSTRKRDKKCNAYHKAGHAAGIHFNNPAKTLVSVDFQIVLNTLGEVGPTDIAYLTKDDNCIAWIEGGRLLHSLPPIISWDCELVGDDEAIRLWLNEYQWAFDADIVNLLVGPLAEAKYVAESDNEPFNPELVNLNALTNYGGGANLDLVDDYLQRTPFTQQQRITKLAESFSFAFHFVSSEANWAAISRLADFIMGSSKTVIGGADVVAILEQSLEYFRSRNSLLRQC
jgi:hypothetical protein